ncbi:hypothetical protein Plec18167_008649 [Paecilomyces lecythidis]|uniref:MARVEL domain-containing protein n=1 Tax=Paecilomyces lecythidis TaxID=3004212 RepID=A0ABR3WUM2_9EURO
MGLSLGLTRPLLLLTRVLQWSSAVIVMGITSYFINIGPRGEHIIYQEVISTISVAFFLPAFISPFLPNVLSKFVLAIDIIFSYLWLTAFIFAAQDYDWRNCNTRAPPGNGGCSKKKANEAFIFLAFFFTFVGIFLEVSALWIARRETAPVHEKHNNVAAETRAADAPADTPAATA